MSPLRRAERFPLYANYYASDKEVMSTTTISPTSLPTAMTQAAVVVAPDSRL
jgi:hypothetical protein